ncbi:hypothetical protein H0H92_016117, partial [Tricholoma furcatifolium]
MCYQVLYDYQANKYDIALMVSLVYPNAEDFDEAMAESESDEKMKVDFLAEMDGKIKESDMTFFHAINYDPIMFKKES